LPDSDGTGIPTTSDGMRDSDELCECSLEYSEEILEAARQALKRQEKMKDVSNGEWIKRLSEDLGKFKD